MEQMIGSPMTQQQNKQVTIWVSVEIHSGEFFSVDQGSFVNSDQFTANSEDRISSDKLADRLVKYIDEFIPNLSDNELNLNSSIVKTSKFLDEKEKISLNMEFLSDYTKIFLTVEGLEELENEEVKNILHDIKQKSSLEFCWMEERSVVERQK